MIYWKPSQERILRDHWGTKSAREIGKLVGKTRNAVIGKADRLGLRRLKTSPVLRAATIEQIHKEAMARIQAIHDRSQAA